MSMRKRLRRVSVVKVAAALAVILLIYPVTIHIVRACVRAETIASPWMTRACGFPCKTRARA